jgi:hypothetical protein
MGEGNLKSISTLRRLISQRTIDGRRGKRAPTPKSWLSSVVNRLRLPGVEPGSNTWKFVAPQAPQGVWTRIEETKNAGRKHTTPSSLRLREGNFNAETSHGSQDDFNPSHRETSQNRTGKCNPSAEKFLTHQR